jgi:hypothetical protein
MANPKVAVLTIYPAWQEGELGLDLRDLLTALKPRLEDWVWCVSRLDWLGEDEDAETFCMATDAASADGVWMSSKELVHRAGKVYQTIEGTFLAYPKRAAPLEINCAGAAADRAWAVDEPVLSIEAIDGTLFEVCARDASLLDLLRDLPGARDEAPRSIEDTWLSTSEQAC